MILVHQVDSARTHIAGLDYPPRQELILECQVVLPDQRGMKVLGDGRCVEIGSCARLQIRPAGGKGAERNVRIGILIAEGGGPDSAVVQRDRIRVPLLQAVHEPVAGHAIIENACAASHYELVRHLIGKAYSGPKIAQRRSGPHRQATIRDQNAIRRLWVMVQVVVRNYISEQTGA